MLKSHERFYSANGKRLVLVADDEWVNRQLLEAILQDRYELIFAEDGQQTLDAMRENRDSLSLVLLDIMMPVLSGTEVLKAAGADPVLPAIAGHEVAPGIAHDGHVQFPHQAQHVLPEALGVRRGMLRLVDAPVDGPAQVLDEGAEQPGRHLPQGKFPICDELNFHGVSPFCGSPASDTDRTRTAFSVAVKRTSLPANVNP